MATKEELATLKRSELRAHRMLEGRSGEYYYEVWHRSFGSPIFSGYYTSAKEIKDDFIERINK